MRVFQPSLPRLKSGSTLSSSKQIKKTCNTLCLCLPDQLTQRCLTPESLTIDFAVENSDFNSQNL